MTKVEISMFREESKISKGVLDVDGIREEFENKEYDYISKLLRVIEENKILKDNGI